MSLARNWWPRNFDTEIKFLKTDYVGAEYSLQKTSAAVKHSYSTNSTVYVIDQLACLGEQIFSTFFSLSFFQIVAILTVRFG